MDSKNKSNVMENINQMLRVLQSENKMTEEERDERLHIAECHCLKQKSSVKNPINKISYGMAANAIHKERNYLMQSIDDETTTGICICCAVTDIIDGPQYCKYCGQRLSAKFGWTSLNYYESVHREVLPVKTDLVKSEQNQESEVRKPKDSSSYYGASKYL